MLPLGVDILFPCLLATTKRIRAVVKSWNRDRNFWFLSNLLDCFDFSQRFRVEYFSFELFLYFLLQDCSRGNQGINPLFDWKIKKRKLFLWCWNVNFVDGSRKAILEVDEVDEQGCCSLNPFRHCTSRVQLFCEFVSNQLYCISQSFHGCCTTKQNRVTREPRVKYLSNCPSSVLNSNESHTVSRSSSSYFTTCLMCLPICFLQSISNIIGFRLFIVWVLFNFRQSSIKHVRLLL